MSSMGKSESDTKEASSTAIQGGVHRTGDQWQASRESRWHMGIGTEEINGDSESDNSDLGHGAALGNLPQP